MGSATAQHQATATTVEWSCKSCGTTDTSLRYSSGKMANCYVCQAYANACTNSGEKKRKRAHKGHVVAFTLEEFLHWAKRNPRVCRYCKMTDAEYHSMGFLSANGKTLEALGLDRLEDDDYRLDNITWCCYPCNRTKNTVFTPEEMEYLGERIGEIWRARRNGDSESQETLFPVARRSFRRRISTMPGEMPVRSKGRFAKLREMLNR
jgi:hypothetical protein